MSNKILIGSLAVVVAALLWSLDGTFLRPNLAASPSTLIVFLEHLLGFIALLPFLIIYRLELKNITKKQWATIFWVALFGGALGTVFFTKALFLTGFKDVSVVILLQKFQPIFAILLAAIFLHERFPRRFYLYALLAVVGGYFTTFRDPFTIANLPSATIMMALLSLAAAFSWGSSTTFGKYSLKNINYGLLAALRFGFTVLILIFPALFYYHSALALVSGKAWITLVIIVFTSGAAAMWLYYYGLKKIPASVATLCELAWPVSAVIFDYFLNHNILSYSQIVGALVLLLAAYKAVALNRPHTISGQVIAGAGRGANLGFHTANLDIAGARGLVKGLYSCAVSFDGQVYEGLLYYGINSLSKKICLEVHILNFSGDVYGKDINIVTDKYLRLPKKFSGADDLVAQMKKDLANVKN